MRQLDIETAVAQEAASIRNQIPEEPWLPFIAANASEAAELIQKRLRSGYRHLPIVTVQVAKGSHGYRPVPIMGIIDRVVYRALTNWILRDQEPLDRSPDAYQRFVTGPVAAVLEMISGPLLIGRTEVDTKYVLEADIAAFYQYIDHEVLRQELEVQTGEFDAIELLLALLLETQGRSYGVPQLVDPSDELSEVYIRLVERDLTRQGFRIWRYNDDFRIGCRDYDEVIDAVERLHESARDIGLTVSDYKTRTPSFWTYIRNNFGRGVSEELAELDKSDVESIVVDYSQSDESFNQERAETVIANIVIDDDQTPHPLTLIANMEPEESADSIHIGRARVDQIRDIRRALGFLARNTAPDALPFCVPLFTHIPSLTPRICFYLTSLLGSHHAEVADILRELTDESAHSMSEWQAIWVINTLRNSSLITVVPGAIDWIGRQRTRRSYQVVGAEAALALAEVGEVEFDELDRAMRNEPEVLAPWFWIAIANLRGQEGGPTAKQLKAVMESSPLHALVIGAALES